VESKKALAEEDQLVLLGLGVFSSKTKMELQPAERLSRGASLRPGSAAGSARGWSGQAAVRVSAPGGFRGSAPYLGVHPGEKTIIARRRKM